MCTTALGKCAAAVHMPPDCQVLDTSVLERLQGGKGSTYQQISTDVVHRICHSSFYDEISEHAELSSDQAVGAIEQAQFEDLYSDIYGSFTSPT